MLSTKEQNRVQVLNAMLEQRGTVREGARLLRLSDRHAWRLLAAYREHGVGALVHGNRGKRPANATPETMREEMVRLAQGPYDGANYSHVADLLAERDGIERSRWTVRRILQAAGVGSSRRRRRAKHRSRRERFSQEGMLLQVDGSRHKWLGEAGPWWTLVGGIDDATGTVPHAVFREQEDAQGYFLLLEGVVERKGIPLAVYSDRHGIFVRSSREPETTIEEQLLGRREPTQMGRALQELGVQWIAASSPQAKGRVERLWQTFQDRLRVELRLAGAQTMADANRVLLAYLPKFNGQFGVPARVAGLAYHHPEGLDLRGILCFKYRRSVAADNTVQFAGRTFQIQPAAQRSTYARARVEVQERLDGSIAVVHGQTVLAATEAPPGPVTLRARKLTRAASPAPSLVGPLPKPARHATASVSAAQAAQAGEPRPRPKPAPNHPWYRTKRKTEATDKIAAPLTLT